MRLLFLTIAIVACMGVDAAPYPISPRPLRLLIKESEIAIEGYVISTGPVKQVKKDKKEQEDFWGGYKATILVKNVLQGKLQQDTIEVLYNPNMICPAPPHFVEGSAVIAFVGKATDKKGFFYTHALSYGVKNLPQEGVEVYKERIREMQDILKVTDEKVQKQQTVEWLVKCATNSYTRWEGTYELSPSSSFMSFYSNGKDQINIYGLSKEHKALLFEKLMAIDTLSDADLGLIDLTWGYDNHELLKLLVRNVKTLQHDWIAIELMQRVNAIRIDPRLEKAIKAYDEVYWSTEKKDEKQKKQLLKDILALL